MSEDIVFKVSVIIPVYNAERYIERAIESAVKQEFVGEVIIIDDGYKDNALTIAERLVEKYSIIKIYQHNNGENRGAGESRNLGIRKATFDYVAFLDADDYFLPNRFKSTRQKYLENDCIDMIYEPVGTSYLNEKCRTTFARWKGISIDESINYITFPTEVTSDLDFFTSLIEGGKGYPHLNGITIKKSALNNISYNPSLRLHQDTDFLIKFAYHHLCVPGELIKPVAMRYVHEENRISNVNYHSRYLLMSSLLNWAKTEVKEPSLLNMIKEKYMIAKVRNRFQSNNVLVKVINKIIIRFL